jgi:hypothetical protein
MSVMPATAVSALADADRLDDDDVVAGGFAQQHGLAGLLGDAAQRCHDDGRRPDEGLGHALRQQLHARLVAEDGAAGNRRRGIHGEHGDAVAALDQVHAQRFDEGRLAHARHA